MRQRLAASARGEREVIHGEAADTSKRRADAERGSLQRSSGKHPECLGPVLRRRQGWTLGPPRTVAIAVPVVGDQMGSGLGAVPRAGLVRLPRLEARCAGPEV